ncbi:Conserved_hypothetical protein [Hexamita inflata]|uniref:Uncharacterized protein n=1 Tax=Hexamita inflata TaxID=28002 RepID=A0AA86TVY1_9EUKA|nr:Conserved hypothetical protein [Hexamita inflata]
MLNLLLLSEQALIQQTFKNCFSPKSYLSGNTQTNQLTLNLIPFEHMDQILDYNQCKTALDKMSVLILLHFDTVSFPRVGDEPVSFTYSYNNPTKVVFKLSPADYTTIISKSSAMYELRYDLDYVIVNGSIKTIEHTKYNGTGCFQSIALRYTIYDSIDILVSPNNCEVDFATGVSVFYEFQKDTTNIAIPILPCTVNCIQGEFNGTTSLFKDVTLYRVRKTILTADLFKQFYDSYVNYRLIKISLNLQFTKNSVDTRITEYINNKTAVDTWGCKTNDQPQPMFWGLQLYTLMNPDGIFVQIRDIMKNKMMCDTQTATKVKLDHYMKQNDVVDRRQFNTTLSIFNEMFGIILPADEAYTNFRNNIYVLDQTYSTIVVSFLDENDVILYELSMYRTSLIGCLTKYSLHLYDGTKNCFRMQFEPRDDCRTQYLQTTDRNSLTISYEKDLKSNLVGYFDFKVAQDYKKFDQEFCFDCSTFNPNQVYMRQTCEENNKLLKQMIKRQQIKIVYTNTFDLVQSYSVVTEYSGIWMPLVGSACAVVLGVVIGAGILLGQLSR